MKKMSRLSAFTIFFIALSVLTLGAVSWNKLEQPANTSTLLPRLEMQKIRSGDYNLTILVPSSFGRKYYSKHISIKHPFYISRHEITIDQWNKCVADGGCAKKAKQRRYQDGGHPVTLVSWFDAYSFTHWLSSVSGDTYRLPTEEEWAYAAFTGKDVTKETIEDLIQSRKMAQTATFTKFRKTRTVGKNGQNSWSITDMKGPVWEWTLTCWFSSDEENKRKWSIAELSNPELCANRVVQGEERAHVPFFVDKVYSGGCGTGSPVDHIGFRVVRETGTLEHYL